MTIDDQLHRALARQADAISLPAADPDAVVRRGSRRRARRRAAIAGVAVLAIGAMSVSVVQRGDKDATVASALAASVVPSPYDWTVVSPQSGLGYSTGLGYSSTSAELDGAVYRLSTAPGPADPNATTYEQRLYRSDDGAEWAEVTLPAGVRTSSLAASDGTLYAVGTAPAGGDTRDLVVATSRDGAATWSNVTLPADVADLEARFPGQVLVSPPVVASIDGTQVVASIMVSAKPDFDQIREAGEDISIEYTDEGVTTYAVGGCPNDGAGPVCPASPSTSSPSTSLATPGRDDTRSGQGEVIGTYTWDELGVPAELQELIGGRTYAYVSDDGTTFERVDLPAGTSGFSGHLLAADDGYRLFVGSMYGTVSSATVLQSADGHTWVEAGALPGTVSSVGLLGGRPAVSLFANDGTIGLQVLQPSGTWVPLDLTQAIDGANSSMGVGQIAFGPLGVAASVWTDNGDNAGVGYLVHSVDGSAVSVVALGDYAGGDLVDVFGIDVSADAITIRIGGPSDGDPATVTPQQVLVGTPR